MKNVAAEVIVIKDPFDEGTVQLSPNTGGQHSFRIAYMERQGTEGLGQKGGQKRGKILVGNGQGGTDPESLGALVELLQQPVLVGCLKGGVSIHQFSRSGEGELMACEIDELGTVVLLQLSDVLRNGGLGDMKGLGGQCIAAQLHYSEKGLKFLVQHMFTSIKNVYYI